jgi:DNA-binding transcriptional LysR family regulator
MAQDDLNVLSAFHAVAGERSFTKAAKRLNVSQSALSHAVRGLEEELGVRLLASASR